MRAAWLSLALSVGLLLPVGCDSKVDPEDTSTTPVVPVTPGEPESLDIPDTPDLSPGPDASPTDELKMPPADGVDPPVVEETPALQAPPVDEGAANDSAEAPMDSVAAAGSEPAAAKEKEPEPMTIGSVAPALDVEYWVSEGFEPVTEFTEGNVYVVEFWATWCGPCVASMPHLAEMQREYEDQGVRLISISDENLETVEKFLERDAPAGEDEEAVTFGELTSAYSLTTDPDRSAYIDYMQAANQNGIPTAFIVGKTGLIEWIGHPMRMDEPLSKVVDGSWDREAYQLEYQLQEKVADAQMLARRGQSKEALEIINNLDTSKVGDDLAFQLLGIKMQILAGIADETEQFSKVATEFLDRADEPMQVYMGGYFVNHAAAVHDLSPDLINKAITLSENALKDAEEEIRPAMLDTVAHLHESAGNLDAAIAAQQEAVDSAEGRMKDRMKVYLNELNEKKNPPTAEDSEPAEGEPADSEPAEGEPADSEPAEGDAEADSPVVEEQPTEAAQDETVE